MNPRQPFALHSLIQEEKKQQLIYRIQMGTRIPNMCQNQLPDSYPTFSNPASEKNQDLTTSSINRLISSSLLHHQCLRICSSHLTYNLTRHLPSKVGISLTQMDLPSILSKLMCQSILKISRVRSALYSQSKQVSLKRATIVMGQKL